MRIIEQTAFTLGERFVGIKEVTGDLGHAQGTQEGRAAGCA